MVKLQRLAAGHYRTVSGLYEVRSAYDPSGAPHVRTARKDAGWWVRDTRTGGQVRVASLDAAREEIARLCRAASPRGGAWKPGDVPAV